MKARQRNDKATDDTSDGVKGESSLPADVAKVRGESPECNGMDVVLAGESPDEVVDKEWWNREEEDDVGEEGESLLEEDSNTGRPPDTTNTVPER